MTLSWKARTVVVVDGWHFGVGLIITPVGSALRTANCEHSQIEALRVQEDLSRLRLLPLRGW